VTTKAEIFAKRKTFDDKQVAFWSDGVVTYSYAHFPVKGAGVARSAHEIKKNVQANWLLANEVGLWDLTDLPRAVKMARKAVRSGPFGKGHSEITHFRYLMRKDLGRVGWNPR
jgi:hypothetical protein